MKGQFNTSTTYFKSVKGVLVKRQEPIRNRPRATKAIAELDGIIR